SIGKPYEVIIVDDGSTDSTPALLKEAMQKLPWLRVIRMARNGGQSAAFEAGFAAARGEIIATIDADLQNDPEEIPRLLPLLDEHKVDMITGWRKERQDTPFRRWQSRQANRIRNWITQETVNDSASSLKIYRAPAIKGLKLFRGAHRYFPTLVKMRGGTVYETPVKHSHRFAGTAKYGFRNRAFVGIADLIGFPGEDYSTIPTIRKTGGYVSEEEYPVRKQLTKAAAQLAGEMGMKMLSTHIGFVPPSSDPNYAGMLGRVCSVATDLGELGLELLMETGQESAPELLQLLNDLRCKNVRVNFDRA